MTTPRTAIKPELKQCGGACLACRDACLAALDHCRQQGGAHCDGDNLRLLQECAECCRAVGESLLTGAEVARNVLQACAEAAARCAQMASGFPGDATMQACSEAALRVASCLKQAATPAAEDYDKTLADSFPASDPPANPARS